MSASFVNSGIALLKARQLRQAILGVVGNTIGEQIRINEAISIADSLVFLLEEAHYGTEPEGIDLGQPPFDLGER